jgi:hypothetical protein
MDDSARPTMTGCGIIRSETDDHFSKFTKLRKTLPNLFHPHPDLIKICGINCTLHIRNLNVSLI